LSAGARANDTEELASLLKIPRNAGGFFIEAHAKLRPVDFASVLGGPALRGPLGQVRSAASCSPRLRGAKGRAGPGPFFSSSPSASSASWSPR